MDYLDHLENGHMGCEFVTIHCAKRTNDGQLQPTQL